MRGFRFTTSVLVGPWRSSREEALGDAVKAGQAVRSLATPDGLEWRVIGRIEECEREAQQGPARRRRLR